MAKNEVWVVERKAARGSVWRLENVHTFPGRAKHAWVADPTPTPLTESGNDQRPVSEEKP